MQKEIFLGDHCPDISIKNTPFQVMGRRILRCNTYAVQYR